MKVCGIELKGNDAIIIGLEGDNTNYKSISTSLMKIGIPDSTNQSDIKSFFARINTFFDEQGFDRIGIRARATKGRFSGGSVSFKMEGLIQISDYRVEVIHPATINAKLKSKIEKNEINLSSVKKYQIESLKLAIYLLE